MNKKNSGSKKRISMVIDRDLYEKSKMLIPNRTADYEDYLRRRLYTGNRPDLLKMEIDELDIRREVLMYEYDHEVGLLEEQAENEGKKQNDLDDAVKIVLNVIESDSVIGLDKLDTIATLKGVSVVDLKLAIPKKIHDKFVKFHPQYKETEGTLR